MIKQHEPDTEFNTSEPKYRIYIEDGKAVLEFNDAAMKAPSYDKYLLKQSVYEKMKQMNKNL